MLMRVFGRYTVECPTPVGYYFPALSLVYVQLNSR